MIARLLRKTCLVATLALAGLTSPALAGENHRHRAADGPPPGAYDFGRARADWLAECRRRMPPGSVRGPESCNAFLRDFYGRVGPYGHGYYGPQTVMVPVFQPAVAEPECTETVEYVTEDVPARRTIRRAPPRTPDKRIRIAPDKRTRVN